MAEEIAEKQGPKPILIAPVDSNTLCKFFFGGLNIEQDEIGDQDYSILEDEN